MAGETGHFFRAMRAVFGRNAGTEFEQAGLRALLAHQLGARRLRVEFARLRIDAVARQADLPFQFGIDDRALDQNLPAIIAIGPFEPPPAVGIAQQRKVGALRRCCRAAGSQAGIGIGSAVAVLAADLHRIGDLGVDQAVAMAVLREMAIGTLQALLCVDVHHVDGFARIDARLDELALILAAPLLGIVMRDDIAVLVEQIALAVALQDRAEIPPVSVIIRELRVAEFGIEIVDIAQEIDVRPFALGGRGFGIAVEHCADFRGRRIFLFLRPHVRRVGFVIPHRVAEIGIQEDVRLVHVAVHALRGRDRTRERVPDGVPALLFALVIRRF